MGVVLVECAGHRNIASLEAGEAETFVDARGDGMCGPACADS